MTDQDDGRCEAVRLLTPEETRLRIAVALSGAGRLGSEVFAPPAGASNALHLLTLVPKWAAEVGALWKSAEHERDNGPSVWIWSAPAPGESAGPFPSQLVIALPGGRYAVSTWDAGSRRVTGTESAAGGPLVCGPPFAGAPLVIAVRRVGDGLHHREVAPT